MIKKFAVLALSLLASTGMASAQVRVNVGLGLPLPSGGYVNVGANTGRPVYRYPVTNYVPATYAAPVYATPCPSTCVAVPAYRSRVRRYTPTYYKPVCRPRSVARCRFG